MLHLLLAGYHPYYYTPPRRRRAASAAASSWRVTISWHLDAATNSTTSAPRTMLPSYHPYAAAAMGSTTSASPTLTMAPTLTLHHSTFALTTDPEH